MSKTPSIFIQTAGGRAYSFTSVPMKRMPSQNSGDWLRFQSEHVPGGALTETECKKLQNFMKHHSSECVTDGTYKYTVAGSGLAFCEPSAIQ